MNAIIIDDEEESRTNLSQLLQEYATGVKVIGEADGVKSGISVIRELNPDLLFLDIQMQDGSGFDLLDFFTDPQFGIIFITAHDEYAIRAFKYHAIDYLLKPIHPVELNNAIKKIQTSSKTTEPLNRLTSLVKNIKDGVFDKIAVSTQEGIFYIKINDIFKFESFRNYTTIFFANDKKLLTTKPISEFEDLLDDTFLRTHQSHIVNLNYVSGLFKKDEGYIRMEDDSTVPLSRRKKEKFLYRMSKLTKS